CCCCWTTCYLAAAGLCATLLLGYVLPWRIAWLRAKSRVCSLSPPLPVTEAEQFLRRNLALESLFGVESTRYSRPWPMCAREDVEKMPTPHLGTANTGAVYQCLSTRRGGGCCLSATTPILPLSPFSGNSLAALA